VKLRILQEADDETLEAAAWYQERSPGLGDDLISERERVLETIGHSPRSLALLEYYTGPHEVRRCIMRRFPYAVIFQCRPGEVLVVAVAHLHREPLYWLDRLDD
jgi:hypothetical protein